MPKSAIATTTATTAPQDAGSALGSGFVPGAITPAMGQDVSPVGGAQEFPALQAVQYTNLGRGQNIGLGLNTGSIDVLTEAAQIQLGLQAIECVFNGNVELIGEIAEPELRWVVLTLPSRNYLYSRDLKKVARQPQGYQIQSGTGIVTAAKCLLAAIVPVAGVDGNPATDFVRTEDGNIQIFTLNLRSVGCNLIGTNKGDYGAVANAGRPTLTGLNALLAKTYGVDPKRWWTHLAGVTIGCIGTDRKQKTGTEESVAATITFGAPAVSLPASLAEEVAAFINTEPIQELFADPFRLDRAVAVYDGPDPFADVPAGVDAGADSEAF